MMHGRGEVWNIPGCVAPVHDLLAVCVPDRKVRRGSNALHLALNQLHQGGSDGEHLEFEARRASIDDENRVH